MVDLKIDVGVGGEKAAEVGEMAHAFQGGVVHFYDRLSDWLGGWRLIEDLGLLKVQSSVCFGKGIQDFLEVI